MDRVVDETRIGHVTRFAQHAQRSRQRAAAPVLDRIAEGLLARRLADQAPVDLLSAALEVIDDPACPVARIAFFIAGDQKSNGAAVPGAARDESLAGGHHGGQAAFHVGGATPIEEAVVEMGGEWRRDPIALGPARHDVGVAGEAEQRRGAAAAGPEIFDLSEGQPLDIEADVA